MSRPRASDRMREGMRRLKNNTDFTLLREHLEAELNYFRDVLVTEVDLTAVAQLQGRARQVQDILKIINEE